MKAADKASVYVALLRGVNLGPNNRVPKEDLAAAFVKCGCAEVKTYINSGNVLFRAGSVQDLATKAASEIGRRCGREPPVVLRTLKEMRSVVNGNPFLKPGVDEKALGVSFLADKPTA